MLCFYCVFIIFTFYLLVHLSLLSFYCFYGFKFLFTFLALLSKHFVFLKSTVSIKFIIIIIYSGCGALLFIYFSCFAFKHFVNSVFKKYRYQCSLSEISCYFLWLQLWGQTPLISEKANPSSQRSAVLLWLQLWGQTPLISENWIWVTTTCRTQQWRSCVVFYRVQPVDWRLWGQFTDFCRSHIYKTAFIHNWSHLILI